MGFDLDAHLIVGLPVSKFKLEEMPLYDEYVEQMKEWHGDNFDADDLAIDELIDDVYYFSKDDLGAEVTSVYIHEESDEAIVGIPIADSEDWERLELDFDDLETSYYKAVDKFYELFDKKPKLYLMPRMW